MKVREFLKVHATEKFTEYAEVDEVMKLPLGSTTRAVVCDLLSGQLVDKWELHDDSEEGFQLSRVRKRSPLDGGSF